MAISQFKRDRFTKKLREQIAFVQRSSQAFDNGAEDEAFRLAVSLRVIFHDTKVSTSLVAHLGFTRKRMLSSSPVMGDWMHYLNQQIDPRSPQPIRMIPKLGNQFREVSIDEWWMKESVFTHKGQDFTRKRIILSAANKDGGAHVDDELEDYYVSLCSGEHGLGIIGNFTYSGEAPFPQGLKLFAQNTHLAMIRQFGHEFLKAFFHFKWLE